MKVLSSETLMVLSSNNNYAFLQVIDSSINTSTVEIWSFSNEKTLGAITNAGKYHISHKLLQLDFVHMNYNRCTSLNIPLPKESSCSCRELRILVAISSSKASKTSTRPQEIAVLEKLLMERILHQLLQKMKH